MNEPHCRLEAFRLEDVSSLIQAADPWSDEWTPQALRASLLAGHRGVVLLGGEAPLGYGVYRFLPDVMEILNIAIFSHSRSKGYGRILIHSLEQMAAINGCKSMWLEVRATNVAALALYRSCEFEMCGQRRQYYRCEDGSRADAILMEKVFKQK